MTLHLVLASGGLDSALLLAEAAEHGEVLPLSVDLPGRPRKERLALERTLRHLGLPPAIRARWPLAAIGRQDPKTGYIPGRNLYLLGLAHAAARAFGANDVWVGTLADDAREFSDATPRFRRRIQQLWDGTRAKGEKRILLRAPFSTFTKNEMVQMAVTLGFPTELTWSCHRDGPRPCRRCRACRERTAALNAATHSALRPARRRPQVGRRQ